jgi:hypothetical protein
MYFEDSPPYTSSIPAPSYSREPNADEERLAFTVCAHRRSLPTGRFKKTSRRVTLTLHEQHRKAKIPVYEHNSLITGTIGLEDGDRVRSVVLKVCSNVVRSAIRHHSRTLLAVRVSDRVASGRGQLPSHQYPLGGDHTVERRIRSTLPEYPHIRHTVCLGLQFERTDPSTPTLI